MTRHDATLLPLHTLNPLERFSNRAEDYAKYRPTYPQDAIDTVLAGLNPPSDLVIADMGAGTGISSRLFAERGATVWAIEPNAAMREAAEPYPLVQFRDGMAEQTGLPDRSVDVITCCQSFHWFEPISTLKEFHRILKPTGRVALLWNNRNQTDEFTAQYTEIVRTASDKAFFDHKGRKSANALAVNPAFTNVQMHRVLHDHTLDLNSLIGLVQSASYVPKTGAAYETLLADLQVLYEGWLKRKGAAGVALSYCTSVYLAEPE